ASAVGTSGTLSFTGGTLQYSAANTTDYSSRFGSAGGQSWRIDTNGQAVSFAGNLVGTGSSLAKLGTGTLTLSGTNTYTGATTVNAGALAFDNPGALYNGQSAQWTAANLTVANGAALALGLGASGRFSLEDAQNLGALSSPTGGMRPGAMVGLYAPDASAANVTVSTSPDAFSGTTANFNTTTLQNLLAGTGVQVMSVPRVSGSGDVTVSSPITWSADTRLGFSAQRHVNLNTSLSATGAEAALTLNAGRADNSGNVNVNSVISLSGNNANLTVTHGSAGGWNLAPFTSSAPGRVDLPGSAPTLSIQGTGYTVINSLSGLQAMNSNLTHSYALGSNIEASATATWNGGAGFVPVGNSTTAFSGRLDGLGHTISGLTINRASTDNVGLLGNTNGAILRNVGLEGGLVRGRNSTGGLAGQQFDSTISNAYMTGTVSGRDSVGGVLGYGGGTNSVLWSYATGDVIGSDAVGGVVGNFLGSTNASVSDSYSKGNVQGRNYVGGLIGWATQTTSSASYATGTVSGNNFVGGLIGSASNTTSSASYATGAVSGNNSVGGLVGSTSSSTVINSYASGSVTGTGSTRLNIGGLVGEKGGVVTNSYATGTVSGNSYVGGLVGKDSSGTTSGFWLKPSDGSRDGLDNGVGTGVNETALRSTGTFSGWDFTTVWNLQSALQPLLRYWQKPLTATVGNVNVTYSGVAYSGTPGISYSVSGFVPQTSPVFDYAGVARNAGSYSINACCLSTQDYVATVVPGVLTIGKATLSLSGSRTYDGSTTATGSTLTASGVNGESFALTGAGSTASKTVGTAALAGLGNLALGTGVNGALAANYNVLSTAGSSYTINQAAITVSGITAQNKTYDGTAAATVVTSGATLSGRVPGDALSVSATGSFDTPDPGTGKTVTLSALTLQGADAGNYVLSVTGQQSTTTADIVLSKPVGPSTANLPIISNLIPALRTVLNLCNNSGDGVESAGNCEVQSFRNQVLLYPSQ
ncbi:MAG: beta strand repeat-containing protein, partial [Betaproteobacteria bacterium]